MEKLNLREEYPDHYQTDTVIEVSDEVAECLRQWGREEAAYRRRVYYHRAFYSLDRADGIEHEALARPVTPWEACEKNLTREQLYAAIASLSDKHARRLVAYYFLGRSKTEIARAEGVNKSQITRSIDRALEQMKKYFQNI